MNDEIRRINPSGMRESAFFTHAVVTPPGATTVYIAGQTATGFDGKPIAADLEGQMRIAFDNLRTALSAAGASPQHVVKIGVYIVDYEENHLEPVGRETDRLFAGGELPASTLVPVPRLALDGLLFEIEATAVVPAAEQPG